MSFLITVILIFKTLDKSFESGAIKAGILLVLFQNYFFFATGHETSFTHIKWEAGFHGFEDNHEPIIRLILMILILLNTFSSTLLVSVGGIGLVVCFTFVKNLSHKILINRLVLFLFIYFIIGSIKVYY